MKKALCLESFVNSSMHPHVPVLTASATVYRCFIISIKDDNTEHLRKVMMLSLHVVSFCQWLDITCAHGLGSYRCPSNACLLDVAYNKRKELQACLYTDSDNKAILSHLKQPICFWYSGGNLIAGRGDSSLCSPFLNFTRDRMAL